MIAPIPAIAAALVLLSSCLSGWSTALAVEPMSWPHHHGPQFNRISRERDLTLDWDSDDPQASSQKQELWQIVGLSAAADPLVFNDKLYVLHWGSSEQELPAQADGSDAPQQRPDQSAARFLSSVSAWHIHGRDTVARFRFDLPSIELDAHSTAPLPKFAGDPIWRQLYCLGMGHELIAIDADYGFEMWQRSSLPPTFGEARVIDTVAPLVYEHLLIVSQLLETKDAKRLVLINGYDRRNGSPVWQHEQPVAESFTLTSPVPCILSSQVALAVPDQGRIELMQIQTGQPLKSLSLDAEESPRERIITELLFQNGQLLSLSYAAKENQAADAKRNWRLDLWTLQSHFDVGATEKVGSWSPAPAEQMTSLLHEGLIYAASSTNRLHVYSSRADKLLHDLEIGAGIHREFSPQRLSQTDENTELLHQRSQPPRYHLVWVANQLLVTNTHGYWQAFDCANSACQMIYTAERNEPLVGIPAISKKRLYVRTSEHLIALGPIDNGDAISHPLIPLSEIANDADSVTPGPIQIVPAFATLEAGWQQSFRILQYNEHGHFLEELDPTRVEWTWTGPGKLDSANATLEIPVDATADQTFELTVKVGKQAASSTISLRSATANVQALSPGE